MEEQLLRHAVPKAVFVLLPDVDLFKEGFPSRCRMRQAVEFERALKVKCLSNQWFAVHIQENDLGSARLGIIVSKRIIPKATARNFVKRTVREIFRRNFPRSGAVDVLVKARKQLPESSSERKSALVQLFRS